MKGKRYTTEQKIRIVRQGQRSETTITDVCRTHQISEQTLCLVALDLDQRWGKTRSSNAHPGLGLGSRVNA